MAYFLKKDDPAPGAPGSEEVVTLSNLLPETRYWVSVRAVDDEGNMGPWSARLEGRTAPVAPNPPTAFSCSVLAQSIALSCIFTEGADEGDEDAGGE